MLLVSYTVIAGNSDKAGKCIKFGREIGIIKVVNCLTDCQIVCLCVKNIKQFNNVNSRRFRAAVEKHPTERLCVEAVTPEHKKYSSTMAGENVFKSARRQKYLQVKTQVRPHVRYLLTKTGIDRKCPISVAAGHVYGALERESPHTPTGSNCCPRHSEKHETLLGEHCMGTGHKGAGMTRSSAVPFRPASNRTPVSPELWTFFNIRVPALPAWESFSPALYRR